MLNPSMTGLPRIAAVFRPMCILLLLAGVSVNLSAAPPTAEYKLKAALIYKLTKFIDWPQSQTGNDRDDFGICLLGDDEFGDALDALEDRKAKELPITIYRHSQSEAIDNRCQIVFISDSKQAFLKPILQSLHARPILTLGDTDGFAEQGGILQFTRGKKRIGFMVNLQSAKKSQLTIAAPLLDLATVVGAAPHAVKE
jgi:hypothetical protein